MSKHFSTWRVRVLSGEGRKRASQMFVREEKIQRGHATRPARSRSVAAAELQATKSEVCARRGRGSFFPPQFFECAKSSSGAAARLPPRLHPHLIFLVSLLRAALPLSLLYPKKKPPKKPKPKSEKREIKRMHARRSWLSIR